MAIDRVEQLPPLNDNYSPPRPWVCASLHRHECSPGREVVGKVGAIPVCEAAASLEIAANLESQRWVAEYAASEEGRREIALEHAWESMVS